jgi:D-alanyl-D-alanine dipeptidase
LEVWEARMVPIAAHRIHSGGPTVAVTEIGLVPITGIKAFLRYAVEGLPGAMNHPFLAAPVFECLLEAQALIRCANPTSELLIWDGYRTRDTQRALFDRYRAKLASQYRDLSATELYTRTREFVSDPDGVFPHGTGGAVDVTLLSYGNTVWMGGDFDDFVPESAADWFRLHPPASPSEETAWRNREFLRAAMERAGFVGIASEWWHFEHGTSTWSEYEDGHLA